MAFIFDTIRRCMLKFNSLPCLSQQQNIFQFNRYCKVRLFNFSFKMSGFTTRFKSVPLESLK